MTDGQEQDQLDTRPLTSPTQHSSVDHPLQEGGLPTLSAEEPANASEDGAPVVSSDRIPSPANEPEVILEAPQAPSKSLPNRHRRKQPKKGILKPPPPPVKPGLGGKLRDALGSIHPKFLDYAGPIGNNTAASVVESIPPSVNNLASNVIEGVGVVGGAAVAVVGSWGGRFGKLVGAATATGTMSADPSNPVTLPWKFSARSPTTTLSPARGAAASVSSDEKDLPLTPTKKTIPAQNIAPLLAPLTPQASNDANTFVIQTDTYKPLKRASFILPIISITYPISSTNPPWSDKMMQDRRKIEEEATKMMQQSAGPSFWDGAKLTELYDIACQGREESARVGIKEALSPNDKSDHRQLLLTSAIASGKNSPRTAFIHVDPPLGKYAAQAFADVLSIRWGLSKLALQDGILEQDESLKPILHALLVSGTLPHLSLSGNRKLRSPGWRMVAAFIRKARNLRFLDLSSNNLDKKSVEYLAHALRHPMIPELPEPTGTSLRESKADESEGSDEEQKYGPIPHISLTTMLKDTRSDASECSVSLQTLRPSSVINSRSVTLMTASLTDYQAQSIRRSDLRNLSLRQNRISNLGTVAIATMIRDWADEAFTGRNPFDTDRSAPLLPSETDQKTGNADDQVQSNQSPDHPIHIPSSITPERLGHLVTLDLKRNDIRGGVNYIAQVLKRNQHLKVLNLSENRIDAAGLASLAEALRLNHCLETLDLSHNPCSGLSIDGVVALRHTFPANTTLRRLFLNNTQMSDEAAIALAEALSGANRLLHIDLTDNNITLAGAMALAGSLRSNTSIRCLDLAIPPNDADMSEISQSILQSCIRNTEAALSAKGAKLSNGTQDAVWAPIKNSSLVRRAKEAEQDRIISETAKTVDTPAAIARTETFTLKPSGVIRVATESVQYAEQLVEQQERSDTFGLDSTEKQRCLAALERSRALLERLADLIQETEEPSRLEQLLTLNDQLTTVIPKVEQILASADKRALVTITKPFAKPTPSEVPDPRSLSRLNTAPVRRRHMRVPSLDAHGPNFSITNSDDDDSDAEELASAAPVSLNLNQNSTTGAAAPTLGNLGAFGLSLHTDNGRNKGAHSSNVDAPNASWALADSCASPLEKVNKEWMAEEGEIFRKGQKLGVAEEDSKLGDKDDPGSSLKQKVRTPAVWLDSMYISRLTFLIHCNCQILEIEVERTPHHLPEEYLSDDIIQVVDSRNGDE
ncbi:hypothetical protein QFC19_003286 [Naganishia cerealis]|uniref:Uncharacterized protein n=1 Tax=Naganishia cerealis TaxID=610337 RepID=A0ACC2W2W7_9TREE|nr:hypothetical protein QFC19_003286 [Naganishia cerealis]